MTLIDRRRFAALTGIAVGGVVFGIWRWFRGRRPSRPRASSQEYVPFTGPLVLPAGVVAATGDLPALYEFAARRPDVLHYLPCFCGCGNAGHRNNYDCFIDEVQRAGTVTIDGMSFT